MGGEYKTKFTLGIGKGVVGPLDWFHYLRNDRSLDSTIVSNGQRQIIYWYQGGTDENSKPKDTDLYSRNKYIFIGKGGAGGRTSYYRYTFTDEMFADGELVNP